MLFKRLLVFICPLILLIGLEILFIFVNNIKAIVLVLAILLLCLLITLKYLIDEKFFSLRFWGVAILPILFYCFTTSYLLLLGTGLLKDLVIIFFCIILAAYFESIFLYFYRSLLNDKYSLENFSLFLNILNFFLITLNLNALSIFLSLPFWLLSICLVLAICLLLIQAFWFIEIKSNYKIIYSFIIGIIILELFWALSFLPADFYVSSVILTILYYFIFGVLKTKLLGNLNKKILLTYSVISIILLIIIIFTSTWT
ncbi:MAG: hypothetical protein A2Y82_00515 [Candidatus Buchananbacteria bacterium RBG_13_36_9]|uniref:Uncharacterized protein n=1 Tax=Candidatus Buchananbacteria bacterium RBG_13_36_9 TaxID=1797530 RepID=A0A1G1XQ88_9BACT|nr:MAG: hypothetical protein A2Y82_00515 [Candidatus Buchananbacteria bacterium RBG_13_36_9]